MSTTTTGVVLEGQELEDARWVALWGLVHDARGHYAARHDGSIPVGYDPLLRLESTTLLGSRLRDPGDPEPPFSPLDVDDVRTLARLADDVSYMAQDTLVEYADHGGSRERVAVAARVANITRRLLADLPPGRAWSTLWPGGGKTNERGRQIRVAQPWDTLRP